MIFDKWLYKLQKGLAENLDIMDKRSRIGLLCGDIMSYNSEVERKPDNIIKMEFNSTTYEVREFFAGIKTLEDIVTQRILIDTQQGESNSPPPTDIHTENA